MPDNPLQIQSTWPKSPVRVTGSLGLPGRLEGKGGVLPHVLEVIYVVGIHVAIPRVVKTRDADGICPRARPK
ncbi:hypothetical protein SLA_3160 [Streptomyces laurentii]|uniref:Uncharacterized protein n=1 Tax=Streptomyces laurentii TaxID=39478 RepID=A0A160P054_STRLU|nr:hypothetical protein SLA_3160 [Streptomyces laurentii]